MKKLLLTIIAGLGLFAKPAIATTYPIFSTVAISTSTTYAHALQNGAINIASGTIQVLNVTSSVTVPNASAATNAVAFGQVSTLFSFRRPVLQYVSSNTVQIESGIDGTSGEALTLFTDGTFRKDSTSLHTLLDLRRVASLSSTKQSGLRTGSVATNTWYAVYAVKATDNSTDFVAVADTVLPIQANFSTLNSNFGTNGWVYLGLIRNGDGGSTTSGILKFVQAGNETYLYNPPSGQNTGDAGFGMILATTAGATSLTWTYAAGTSGAVLPNNISLVTICFSMGASTGSPNAKDSGGGNYYWFATGTSALWTNRIKFPALQGILVTPGASTTVDIMLR